MKEGGENLVTLTTSQIPSHKHDTNIDGGHIVNGGSTFPYGGAGTYSSTVFSMSNTGGGGSYENRPPYYALCYIIQYAQGGDVAKGQKGEAGSDGGKKIQHHFLLQQDLQDFLQDLQVQVVEQVLLVQQC